jgi:transcriptional regulator with XRE-family HTH domain
MNLRKQLLEKFKDKEYRDSFVREFIYSRLPLKIRAMRDRREMSQAELGEKAGVAQAWVSKLEDPNYGRLTISTLLKIASSFDCGLSVDFVPFSQILNGATRLSPRAFDVPSFSEDVALENELMVVSSIRVPDTGTVDYYEAPKPQNEKDGLVSLTDTEKPAVAQPDNTDDPAEMFATIAA